MTLKDIDLWSRYWRLITFLLGLIAIYLAVPGEIHSIYFWELIACYTIGAIVTWSERLENDSIKLFIGLLLSGIIEISIIPEMDLENNLIGLLVVLIVVGYVINSLLAKAFCEIILSIYKTYFKVHVPGCIKYSIDGFINFISCLNPFGIIIYLGMTFSILPHKQPIYEPVNKGLSELKNYSDLLREYIKNIIPKEINNLLALIRDSLLPIIQALTPDTHSVKVADFLSIFLLFLIAISIQLFIDKTIHRVIYKIDGIIYSFIISRIIALYIIIYLLLNGLNSVSEFSLFVIIIPIIGYLAIRISDFINTFCWHDLFHYGMLRKIRFFFCEITHSRNNNIFILLDISESMRDENKIESAKKEIIRLLNRMKNRGNKIGLVTFGGMDSVNIYDLTEDYQKLANAVKTLEASGTTPLYKAIKDANEKLKGLDNRMIYIITDGHLTVTDWSAIDLSGRNVDLEHQILSYIRYYVHYKVKTLGIGININKDFLEEIEKISIINAKS